MATHRRLAWRSTDKYKYVTMSVGPSKSVPPTQVRRGLSMTQPKLTLTPEEIKLRFHRCHMNSNAPRPRVISRFIGEYVRWAACHPCKAAYGRIESHLALGPGLPTMAESHHPSPQYGQPRHQPRRLTTPPCAIRVPGCNVE